jgi:hypothetical protein
MFDHRNPEKGRYVPVGNYRKMNVPVENERKTKKKKHCSDVRLRKEKGDVQDQIIDD